MNFLPVSTNVRQLSNALRKAKLISSPFHNNPAMVKQFKTVAEALGFHPNEVTAQIEAEKLFHERSQHGNGSKRN